MTGKLTGAKSILRYLAEHHGIAICRETLYRLRTAPEREFSCSDIEAGATAFPAAPLFDGVTVSIVADPAAIDRWVTRHRRAPPPD